MEESIMKEIEAEWKRVNSQEYQISRDIEKMKAEIKTRPSLYEAVSKFLPNYTQKK